MFRFRRKKKSSDPLAVVQRFVDAANRHDAQGVADCLHSDFDSVQPIYPSRSFRGSDQVRRNWQAIFRSEPGFRLTLLRSATADGTVWVELHGAGREAEVAAVFIMGVDNDLVRWARVYSAVVDQEFQGPVDTGEQAPAIPVGDGVSDAQVAAKLREMVDAGRLRVVAVGGQEDRVAADDAAFAPEPEAVALVLGDDDSLGTGEVPVAVVDDEPGDGGALADQPAREMPADELPAAWLPAGGERADAPIDDAPIDDAPVDEAEGGAPVDVSLEDLLGEGPAPEPPSGPVEAVTELVRPAVPSAAADGMSAGPDLEPGEDHGASRAEPAVLELRPQRRFGRPLRRP